MEPQTAVSDQGKQLTQERPCYGLTAILLIAFLVWVFWHYGIISAIWEMLGDFLSGCADFFQWVVNQRSH